MLSRHDERVSVVYRLDVEERDRIFLVGDHAPRLGAVDDAAKDTRGAMVHDASSATASSSARVPRTASSIDAASVGVCEPPVERTKIMPVGTPASAGFWAS